MKYSGLLLFTILSCLGVSTARAAESAPPNILFILCDDLGYGDLGCFGNPTIKTPNLDKLAAEGMKLTSFYVASPVCSPSRAAFLTGRMPDRLGIQDWITPDSSVYLHKEAPSIARILRKAGYSTGHFGKWHLSGTLNGSQPTPSDFGFDYWLSTENTADMRRRNPVNFVRNGKPTGELEGFSGSVMTDEAIHWLETREDRRKPFCIFLWFREPHEPIDPPEEFASMYPNEEPPARALYYGDVTHMDFQIGRFLQYLDKADLRKNTLVFFTSDNGPETLNRYPTATHSYGLPGRLRGMKLELYEGGIRVPAILSWPGKTKPGTICDEPVHATDLLPTLCAVAGVKVPEDASPDGANFLPILQGQRIERAKPLYWHYPLASGGPNVAMRIGEWKILARVGPFDPDDSEHSASEHHVPAGVLSMFELYHLSQDISESSNLAVLNRDRFEIMRQLLKRMFEETSRDSP